MNIILEMQTLIGKMIKSIEFSMCYIDERFYGIYVSEYETLLIQWTNVLFVVKGIVYFKLAILVISIVIDSDRGHWWALKKEDQNKMKIEPVTYIWMFVYVMNFELPEMSKKWTLDCSGPNSCLC